MEIICNRCGLINDYKVVEKSNQRTAWCNGCGNYIKNIPHGNKPTLHFGKYKSRTIESMRNKDEVNYLNWLYSSTIKLNPILKEAIKKQLGL